MSVRHSIVSHVIGVLVVLTLFIPAGAANWKHGGSNEPDTAYDSPSWMFFDRAPPDELRLYFNGYAATGPNVEANPNLALIGSAMESPVEHMHAILGVWVDCNGDDYIGYGEQGLTVYRSDLLTLPGGPGPTVCPPQHAHGRTQYPFNDGVFVREFLPITPFDNGDPLAIHSDAAVWGDRGLPGENPRWCGAEIETPRIGGGVYYGCVSAQPARRASDFPMHYVQATTLDGSCSRGPNGAIVAPSGTCPPGLVPLGHWESDAIVARTPILIDPSTLAPEAARYATFYGDVGAHAQAGFQLPGALGVYGSQACGSMTSGIANGWHCSPGQWTGARPVGSIYQMRDVDCWNGSPMRGLGLGVPTFSAGGDCVLHPMNPHVPS